MTSRRSAILLVLAALALVLVAWVRWSGPHTPPGAPTGVESPPVPAPRVEPALPPPEPEPVEEPSVASEAAPVPAPAGPSLTGVVADELGRPWEQFRIRLRPADAPGTAEPRPVEHVFEAAEDGVYTIHDLTPGRWFVSAASLSVSEEHEVEIAASDVELDLVLPRPARVAGRVLDPAGAAPAGAEVRLLRREDGGLGLRSRSDAFPADDEGRFELEVAPGAVVLQAAAAGFAPSAPLELELAPAEARESLSLALRRAARIAGRVLDERGEPEAGRGVWLTNVASGVASGIAGGVGGEVAGPGGYGPVPAASTDPEGAFAFEGLAPGTYEIARVATRAEEAAAAESAEASRALARLRTAQRIELAEGESVEVVLGGASEPELRLWGFVLGAPAERQTLFVEARDATQAAARLPFSRIDERGAYELVLDAPGAYAVSVQSREGVLLSLDVDVEDLPSQRLDLEIGDASLQGRVLDPDGEPVAGADVSLEPSAAGRESPAHATSSRRASCDALGAFVFSELAPGTYALAARVRGGTAPPVEGRSGEGRPAAARVEGIEIAPHARLEGLEIRLAPAGAIDVVVAGPSGPIAGADVRTVDASGRPADAPRAHATDAAGKTRIVGLPPGTWFVRASSARLAGAWSGPIAVGAGESASARLELAPGALLAVTLPDARAPGAWLVVQDELGLELARAFAPAGSRSVATLGPLPFGRFTLRAEDPAGRTHERLVVVDSARTLELDLALGE
jgi:protocatechuate 3,4-dioxygenase beta subunit